jgi:hypothetical protein
MNEELALIALMLRQMRKELSYKAALYGEYAKQSNGITRSVWQGKSVAMVEALRASNDLTAYMEQNHAPVPQKKRPALRLAVVNPDVTSIKGNNGKLTVVTK